MSHLRIHSFTGTTDHDFTGLVPGELLEFDGTNIVSAGPMPGAGGIYGISNQNGEYTYYSTLQDAIDAAFTGDTVQVFSNYTETGSTEVNLKDGVDINFNGYTYRKVTNDNTSMINASNVACRILNGIIIRENNGVTCINVDSSDIDFTGTKMIQSGTAFGSRIIFIQGDSKVRNGEIYQTISTTTSYGIDTLANDPCEINNFYIESGQFGARINTSNKKISNCIIKSSNTGISTNTSDANQIIIEKCTINSDTGIGVDAFNSISIIDSSIKSNTNIGVRLRDSEIINSKCYSTTNIGLSVYSTNTNKKEIKIINTLTFSEGDIGAFFDRVHSKTIINNLYAFSLVSEGVHFDLRPRVAGSFPNQVAYNVDLDVFGLNSISEADSSILIRCSPTFSIPPPNPEFRLSNFKATSLWDDPDGHSIDFGINNINSNYSNFDFYINNGACTVENSSGHCLNNVNIFTCKFSNLTFAGSSAPINNVNQGMTNTADNYGNISID